MMPWLVSGVLSATAAVGAVLPGPPAQDPPPVPPPPPHQITLTPEQSARVCQRLIPGALAGIDRAQGALGDSDAQTPGSAGWLNSWADQAEKNGRPGLADALRGWAQHGADRLNTWRGKIDAFRAANCQ
jgi:hypothetical protein